MPQISGKNTYYTYKVSIRTDINLSEKITDFEKLIKIISSNRLIDFEDPSKKGFVAYQFDNDGPIENSTPIEKSTVQNMLVVKHIEKKVIKNKPLPQEIIDLKKEKDIPENARNLLEKFIKREYIRTIPQDFIFIPGDSVTLIFPSNNCENTLTYQLVPYLGDIFDIVPDINTRRINHDLLEWLTWKVKRTNNGALGDIYISEIQTYDSNARGNDGDLNIKIPHIEQNMYAMLSMGLCQGCKGVDVTLSYNKGVYRFILRPEGSYTPIWTATQAYDTDNSKVNKILTIRDISLKIIPYLYKKYVEDKHNWDNEKGSIQDNLLEQVRKKIEV
ncbi:hypothetical protein [Methanooceanicella nereidis]|nr:hypothetical protein [Methanocella sp. CWC-04]